MGFAIVPLQTITLCYDLELQFARYLRHRSEQIHRNPSEKPTSHGQFR